MEITTSVAESIPSPNTAKLPANMPTPIFKMERIALPMILIHEARIKICSLSFIDFCDFVNVCKDNVLDCFFS
jgi:hypothetical protein